MSQRECEFFSTPSSSHFASSEQAIITDIDVEFTDLFRNKRPAKILAAAKYAAQSMRKLSPEMRKIGQQMLEWIASSQKQGISAPQIAKILSIKVKNPKFASEIFNNNDEQTSSISSASPKIAKISEYSSAKSSDNHLMMKKKNRKYFLNDHWKNQPLILCPNKRLEKLDNGFMAKNKDQHLINYLNSLNFSPSFNGTEMLQYPKEEKYQFGFAKNRKRLRNLSVSTCHTSLTEFSETDHGFWSGADSEYDTKNCNSIIAVNTQNKAVKRRSTRISAKNGYKKRNFDFPESYQKSDPCEIVVNLPKIPKKGGKRILDEDRLEKNRVAAQKLRLKKRQERLTIEQQELELKKSNIEWKKRVEELEAEIQKAKDMLIRLEN